LVSAYVWVHAYTTRIHTPAFNHQPRDPYSRVGSHLELLEVTSRVPVLPQLCGAICQVLARVYASWPSQTYPSADHRLHNVNAGRNSRKAKLPTQNPAKHKPLEPLRVLGG
jgi:hypothetical protein